MNKNDPNIVVVGAGYVGLSIATLLSTKYKITLVDIIKDKVDKINSRICPIKDTKMEHYFSKEKLNLTATTDTSCYVDAKFVIICLPTNYDETTNYFDTKAIEDTINNVLKVNKNVVFIIKSTIPIGYTNKLIEKFHYKNIMFSPEFLRESYALYDNLLPSRIIAGVDLENKLLIDYANLFIDMLLNCTLNKATRCLVMGTTEAESVKLFANEYLAMRVSFFNELDTFAKYNNLKTNQIIEGVCADGRIGNYYNNPSFGYGGYCLPKDTKQLLSNFNNIPQNLISAIVQSNDTRKLFIVNDILNKLKSINTNEKVVGIYRLIMKSGSDNFRCSAVKDIMEKLKENNIRIVIYEPNLTDITYEGYEVINDFTKFNKIASIIVANRYDTLLDSDIVDSDKIYSCDIYRRD